MRAVFLVKAIEESDRAGTVIPLADRVAATRDAGREAAAEAGARELAASADGRLPARTARLLARRARILHGRLLERYPVVASAEALADGPPWLAAVMMVFAVAVGAALSALDGSRRINVLAFPLAGIVAWNLVVYAWLAFVSIRSRPHAGRSRPAADVYRTLARRMLASLVGTSARFNTPLAHALGRFAHEWHEVSAPWLAARAKRLFHLAAVALVVGLVAGLYVRGIAWRYDAGWESTFLDARAARVVIVALYGPASALSGIALPGVEALQAMRWDGGRGTDAAPWIHLISITAALWVVLPRLLLAAAATLAAWRHQLRPPLPPSLRAYAARVLGEVGVRTRRGVVAVFPYAYVPAAESIAGLRSLLPAAFGEELAVDVRDTVRYGDEDSFAGGQAGGALALADTAVMLVSLAATPEDENHGVAIRALRDRAGGEDGLPLLVVVDETPYAARLGSDPSLRPRLEERRALWRGFVAGHGLTALCVDLAAARDNASDQALLERARDALASPAHLTDIR